MTTQYIQYPASSGGVTTYTNLAAFPATGTDGQLGIALDTHAMYEWTGAAWALFVKTSTVDAITALTGDVTATGSASSSVPATVAFVGTSSAANVHAAELLANAATSANTASTIVKRDGSGNFTAGTVTAALTGNVTGNCSGTAATFTGNLTGAVTSVGMATTIVGVTGTTNLGNGTSTAASYTKLGNIVTMVFTSVFGGGLTPGGVPGAGPVTTGDVVPAGIRPARTVTFSMPWFNIDTGTPQTGFMQIDTSGNMIITAGTANFDGNGYSYYSGWCFTYSLA